LCRSLAYVAQRGAAAPAAAWPAAAPAPPAGSAEPPPAGTLAATAGPPVSREPGDEVIAPDAIRRAIAQRMVQSKQPVPHAWTMVEVDVTSPVAWRGQSKEEVRPREGVGLTYPPLFIKAAVERPR